MADFYEDLVSGNAVVLPVDDPEWTSYSSGSGLFGTGSKAFSTSYQKYRQVRNGYEIIFSFGSNSTASGGGSSTVYMNLPPGAVLGSNYLGIPSTINADGNDLLTDGYEYGLTTTGQYNPLAAMVPNTSTSLRFFKIASGTEINSGQMNNTNLIQITGRVWVPIQGLSASKAYGAGFNTSGPSLVNGRTPRVDLVNTDFTSQTNVSIDAGDVVTAQWSKVDGRVFLDLILNTITITASAPDVRFTLPASIPRPNKEVQVPSVIFDNSTTVMTPGFSSVTPAGIVVFTKNTGAFTGGTNTCCLRAQISWNVT